MADVLARLRVESQEYDAKLKRAVSQLQQMEKEVLATAKESFERCMARYLQLQPAEPEEK